MFKKLAISMLALSLMICPMFTSIAYAADDVDTVMPITGETRTEPDENAQENAEKEAEKIKQAEKLISEIDPVEQNKSAFEEFMNSPDWNATEASLLSALGDTSKSSYTYYYVYVPYHAQEESYWCGPASGQQTIDTWINNGHFSGSLPTQTLLASMMYTSTSGTSVYSYRNAINLWLGTTDYATSIINDTSDKTTLKNASITGASSEKPVTYLVVKNILSYYAGTSDSGHYISGSALADYGDYAQDWVSVKDCNNVSPYGGFHSGIAFNQMYSALVEYYDTRGVANLIW